MKFKHKDETGGVSVRGHSYVVEKFMVELPDDLTPDELDALKSMGVEPAPPTEEEVEAGKKFQAEQAKIEADKAAERAEKSALLEELKSEFGIEMDGRKSLAAIRTMVERAREGREAEKKAQEAKKPEEAKNPGEDGGEAPPTDPGAQAGGEGSQSNGEA